MIGKQLFLTDEHAKRLRERSLLRIANNPERTHYVAIGLPNGTRRDEAWELVWVRPNHWRFTGMMRSDDLEQICGKKYLHGFAKFFALDAGLFTLVGFLPDDIESFRRGKQAELANERYRCGLVGHS